MFTVKGLTRKTGRASHRQSCPRRVTPCVPMGSLATTMEFLRPTAAPFAKLYGRIAARMGECEESRATTELPLRESTTPRSSG